MYKKLALSSVIGAALVASGCGGGSKSSSPPAPTPTTTSFSVCLDDGTATNACTLPTQASLLRQQILSFMVSQAHAAAISDRTGSHFYIALVADNGTLSEVVQLENSHVSAGSTAGLYTVTLPENVEVSANSVLIVNTSNTALTLGSNTNISQLSNVVFTLLSDISDSDGDGVTVDLGSSSAVITLLENSTLSDLSGTQIETALASVINATNPENSLLATLPTANRSFNNMSITGSVSGSGSQAQAALSTDQGLSLEDAVLTIIAYDQNGSELSRSLAETDASGQFQVTLPDLSNTESSQLARIEVTINKDGYITGEKVFTSGFKSGATLSLRSLLGQVEVITASRDQLAFSASGKRSFRLGLVRSNNGQIAAVAGEAFAQARAAADTETLLDINIPESCVPSDISAVTGRLAYFDPNNANDVQSFPGDFKATGNPDVAGDGINLQPGASSDDPYRLISSVFSQVSLEDQNGTRLNIDPNCAPAGEATAAADDDASMTVQVPTESYDTITEDRDPALAGIQVPIYIYRNGWKFAGNGTLQVVDGADYIHYDGTVPPTVDATPSLFVTITIDEGNEWIKWVNLDWPIRAESNTQNLCVTGTVTYAGEDNEPYWGGLDIQSSTGYEFAYVDNGVVDFTSIINSSQDALGYTYRVWNQRTQSQQTLTAVAASPAADGCDQHVDVTTELDNPLQCKVSGQVTHANGTPGRWLSMNLQSGSYYVWASTDQNGRYDVNAPCDVDSTISLLAQSETVDADNFDNNGEQTINFTLENQLPFVYAYGPYSTTVNTDTRIDVYAYDYDGSIDSVSVTCPDANCTTPSDSARFTTFNAATPGLYTLSFVATDDAGGSSTPYSLQIQVEPSGNKTPRIDGFSVSGALGGALGSLNVGKGSTIGVRDGDSVTIMANAFDPDANPLTYSWTGCDSSTEATCQLTTSGAGTTTVSVTVTDQPLEGSGDPASATASLTLDVMANNAPVIEAILVSPSRIIDGGSGNVEPVRFNAFVFDDFTRREDLAYTWTVTANSGASTAALADNSGPELVADAGELSAGSYTVSLTVSDGDQSTSRSTTFTVLDHTAPQLSIPDDVSVLANDQGTNAQAITLNASANDDLTPANDLSFSWRVTGSTLSSAIEQSGASLSIAAGTLAVGTYTAEATVSDGDKQSSDTLTITVTQDPANTTIVIQ